MLHSRSLLPQQTHCSPRLLLHHLQNQHHHHGSDVAVRMICSCSSSSRRITPCRPAPHLVCVTAAAAAPGSDSAKSSSRQGRSRPTVGSSSGRDSPQHRSAAGGSSKAGRSSRGPADKPQQQQQGWTAAPRPYKQQQLQPVVKADAASLSASAATPAAERRGTKAPASTHNEPGANTSAGGSSSNSNSRQTASSSSATPGKRKFYQSQQQHSSSSSKCRSPQGGGNAAAKKLTGLLSSAVTPRQLLQLVQQRGDEMNALHVAAAYYKLGRFCKHGAAAANSATAQQLLQHLGKLLPPTQQQMQARQLSNIIWGCAYAQHPSVIKQLLPAFLQHVATSAANPFDISNVMWALANRGFVLDSQQLQQVVKSYTRQVDTAKPQGIANVLWAVATMEQQLPAEQCTTLVAALVQKLDKANPQDISNGLWAVSKMGQHVSHPHLQKFLDAFVNKLGTANSQDVANTLWAVADMQQCVPDQQLQLMLEHLSGQLHKADPQHVSNSLWACAKFGYAPTHLLSELEQQEQQTKVILAAANPQTLANMAWACGQLGYKAKLLLSAVLQQGAMQHQQGSRHFNCQDLCNLCWSVAVLDMQQHIPSVLQLARATTDMWEGMSSEGLQQLDQVHVWLQDCQLPTAGAGLVGVLTQQQLEQCRHSWEQQLDEKAAVPKASGLQQSVFTTLRQLPATTWQQPPAMEQRTADGAFSIDIAAVTAAGVALAIEVDGPWHFVRPGNMVDGPTLSRNRALAARRYTVISIPYWEWNKQTGQQRVQYVRELLRL